MIPIRAPAEIDAIARAGAVVASTLDDLTAAAQPGVATIDLDALARRLLRRAGAIPLFPGFVQRDAPPFPSAICVCINQEATHGVPGPRRLEPGDLVTIDLGASLAGWCADASRVVVLGADRADRAGHARAARAATDAATAAMAPGVLWSAAADAARLSAEAAGFRLVPGYAGHGVGRALHEPPRAPMYPGPKDDFTLRAGMVLTVEPILVAGQVGVAVREDGWTVATADGSDACQVEETVAVVRGGVRVLTSRETGPPPS